MGNDWCYNEAVEIFGKDLGNYIFDKYTNRIDTIEFFMGLDSECRLRIIARAEKFYE